MVHEHVLRNGFGRPRRLRMAVLPIADLVKLFGGSCEALFRGESRHYLPRDARIIGAYGLLDRLLLVIESEVFDLIGEDAIVPRLPDGVFRLFREGEELPAIKMANAACTATQIPAEDLEIVRLIPRPATTVRFVEALRNAPMLSSFVSGAAASPAVSAKCEQDGAHEAESEPKIETWRDREPLL